MSNPSPEGTRAVPEPTPMSAKQQEAREGLPINQRDSFDALVEAYVYAAFMHTRAPFVHYGILADLVREGWTRNEEPPALSSSEAWREYPNVKTEREALLDAIAEFADAKVAEVDGDDELASDGMALDVQQRIDDFAGAVAEAVRR